MVQGLQLQVPQKEVDTDIEVLDQMISFNDLLVDMVMIKQLFNGKLGMMHAVTSH